MLTERLPTALNSRMLIEQAKGVLAERLHLDMADAITLLPGRSRSNNRRLSDVSRGIMDGSEQVPPATMDSRPAASRARRS
jgi:AmiR/NasT family two-component response regulator